MRVIHDSCPDCGAELADVNTVQVIETCYMDGSIYTRPKELKDWWQVCMNEACAWSNE